MADYPVLAAVAVKEDAASASQTENVVDDSIPRRPVYGYLFSSCNDVEVDTLNESTGALGVQIVYRRRNRTPSRGGLGG